jgi:hypothetical protein
VAISGATQTGPNLFWICGALQLVAATGDVAWLREWLPRLEAAMEFILSFFDPSYQLLRVPGPLWIDVFIRENYTSDSNAFAVHALRQMAGVERYVGGLLFFLVRMWLFWGGG